MGFSLKKIASTVNPLTVGSSLLGHSIASGGNPFDTKFDTQGQVPLETAEQREARRMLNEFAKTGKFGDFTAGQDLGLGLGDFDVTGIEQMGLSNLQNLLSSGIPDQFRLGDDALKDLLATSPGQIEAQFSPFKTLAEREIRNQSDSVKRNAAFGGNLFSTGTYRALNDVGARGAETLTAELARLTNEALNRRERAIPLAYQSGTAQEGIRQDRIGSAFQFGGLTRNLNDAKIKSRDAEILRRRQELQLPIQTAQVVSGSNVPFGVPEVKVAQPNPFLDILSLVIQGGSQIASARAGRPVYNFGPQQAG